MSDNFDNISEFLISRKMPRWTIWEVVGETPEGKKLKIIRKPDGSSIPAGYEITKNTSEFKDVVELCRKHPCPTTRKNPLNWFHRSAHNLLCHRRIQKPVAPFLWRPASPDSCIQSVVRGKFGIHCRLISIRTFCMSLFSTLCISLTLSTSDKGICKERIRCSGVH